jgi:DNA-binding response OmpR family regulator
MGTPTRILVIDDNEQVLTAVTQYLETQHFEVVSASNGLDALKILETEEKTFQMIITDLVMPNISGVGVISIVKKKLPRVPIIAITGWGEHPEALATEAHADRVLEKPFDLAELTKIINELLTSKKG